MPVPFGTADDCLFEFGRLQAGETVLVHAGASGVGIAAIQLAKRAGARVLATASRDEKLERLVELGLDDGINYATDRLRRGGPPADRRAGAPTSSSTRSADRPCRGASAAWPTGAGA